MNLKKKDHIEIHSIGGIGPSKMNRLSVQLGLQKGLERIHSKKSWTLIIERREDVLEDKYAHVMRLRSLKQMNTFRGNKLRNGLPARGQRTHSNASTARRLNMREQPLRSY